MKTPKINKSIYGLATLAFLLLLLLFLALFSREKYLPLQKASVKTKPVSVKPQEIKPSEISLKEIRLAEIPNVYEKWSNITFSADGSHVVYAARNKQGRQLVVVGDKPGRPYDAVWTDTIVLSRDGKRIAFSGKKGGKWYFVLDGKEEGPYDNTGSTYFSLDDRFVICEVKADGKWSVSVYDGPKVVYRSQAYPRTLGPMVFSPDGRLLIYKLGEENNRNIFFLDLAAQKVVKKIAHIDGERPGKIYFSSDSSRVVFEVRKDGKNFLALHDFALKEERKAELPYTTTGEFVFSPDGKKIAYVATREGKTFFVVSTWEAPVQGNESGPYEGIRPAVFSPDSAKVAYLAMKRGKWRSAVGDKESETYDNVGYETAFSPDGAKIAYAVMKDGKWRMVVSPASKPAEVKEGPVYDIVISPVFSPDGSRIAYRARMGSMENAKRFIVIEDAKTGKVIKEGPVGDEIWPPVWSADGKTVGYGARIGRELWWKVEKLDASQAKN